MISLQSSLEVFGTNHFPRVKKISIAFSVLAVWSDNVERTRNAHGVVHMKTRNPSKIEICDHAFALPCETAFVRQEKHKSG